MYFLSLYRSYDVNMNGCLFSVKTMVKKTVVLFTVLKKDVQLNLFDLHEYFDYILLLPASWKTL